MEAERLARRESNFVDTLVVEYQQKCYLDDATQYVLLFSSHAFYDSCDSVLL